MAQGTERLHSRRAGAYSRTQRAARRIRRLDEAATARVFDVRRLPGGRYVYQKRLATEDVAKLYMRDGLTGEEKLLVDP